jgi:hypothetical protein
MRLWSVPAVRRALSRDQGTDYPLAYDEQAIIDDLADAGICILGLCSRAVAICVKRARDVSI